MKLTDRMLMECPIVLFHHERDRNFILRDLKGYIWMWLRTAFFLTSHCKKTTKDSLHLISHFNTSSASDDNGVKISHAMEKYCFMKAIFRWKSTDKQLLIRWYLKHSKRRRRRLSERDFKICFVFFCTFFSFFLLFDINNIKPCIDSNIELNKNIKKKKRTESYI